MRCLNCHKDGIPTAATVCPGCGVYLPSLLRDVLPAGTLLKGKNYRIDYALGRGGFGITYRAMHVLLERAVAVKEYYPQEYVRRDEKTDSLVVPIDKQDAYHGGLQRFIREGKILCQFRHPNVVQVLDLFEEHHTAYLVMELVQGSSLTQEIAHSGRLPEARLESLIGQLVEALSAIHAASVCHLDLKPDNVMLLPGDRVVLIDFGTARQGYTSTDTSTFTLEYAAPEVVTGNDVGTESDIFELGMMLHELLTGTRPPSALARLTTEASSSWRPRVAEPWQSLLESALQLRKKDRPSSILDWWKSRTIVSGKMPTPAETVITEGIWVKCPNPEHSFDFEVDKAGPAVCPDQKCGWKFTVDRHGNVIEGKPIKTTCPSCQHLFYAQKEGLQRCPHDSWEFEIDRDGVVVGGKPLLLPCPNCAHEFPIRGAGEYGCPACKWKFMVNRYGIVTAGKPIEVTCPVCLRRFRVQRPGSYPCPVCQTDLQVDGTGIVVH